MKKILIVLAVMLLVSCDELSNQLAPDLYQKFESTVVNNSTQEIKYKYEVSEYKSKGEEGMTKSGILKPKDQIEITDIAYRRMVHERQALLHLYVPATGKIYTLLLATDSTLFPKPNQMELSDPLLEYSEDDNGIPNNNYGIPSIFHQPGKYQIWGSLKDSTYFD